jgi:hypothetical protein
MRAESIVFSVVVAIGFLVFSSLYFRYRRRELQHKEMLAALEKGIALPELHDEVLAPRSGRIYLLRGMMWLFSGIAIVVFLSAIAANSRQAPNMQSRLRRTEELKRFGATDEQLREAEKEPAGDSMPGGIALLGLVPIGIGLAYLIYYGVERKNGGTTTPS